MTYQPNDNQKTNFFTSQRVLIGCIALVVLAAAFLGGTGLGFGIGRITAKNATPPSQAVQPAPSAEEGAEDAIAAPAQDFGIFSEAMGLFYQDFFGPLPATPDANYEAIKGVLSLIDDPNTSFLTPEEADFFRTSIQGTFEGIGARVAWDEENEAVKIVEPFENQPAWKAGIRRNDLIIAINGEPTAEMDLTEAVGKIRGAKGTEVTLSLRRDGEADDFDVVVVRDQIETPVISTEMVGANGDIGYVELTTFSNNSGRLVRQAVEDVLDRNPRALIFDLRGNAGGLLNEAINVASVFLEEGDVLIERFSDGTEEIYRTRDNAAIDKDLPLVVLVNEGSASASEIVAGALQDSGRAILIGTTTFGKGSVQLPHTLSDGSIMRVTIARWFTPKDRTIDGTGLDPDILVEITDAQFEAGEDPQLERALQFLETGQ